MTSTARSNTEIEAIIFDIGRVIVKLDPVRAFAHIAKMTAARDGRKLRSRCTPQNSDGENGALGRELYQAIQRDPMWSDWQEGRVTPMEWYQTVCARFSVKASFTD